MKLITLQPLNLNNNSADEESKGGCLDLFRRRNLALWTLVIFFNWFANSFVYYGLTLNSGSIGGSYQLNFLLNGIFELPAYTITLYVLLKVCLSANSILVTATIVDNFQCGRRMPYVVLMLLGAASLLCTTLVSKNDDDSGSSNWPVVALAMAGKFCVTGTFGIVYVYSAEVFPTVVRSVGVGTASVFARVGGAVAPYVGSLRQYTLME